MLSHEEAGRVLRFCSALPTSPSASLTSVPFNIPVPSSWTLILSNGTFHGASCSFIKRSEQLPADGHPRHRSAGGSATTPSLAPAAPAHSAATDLSHRHACHAVSTQHVCAARHGRKACGRRHARVLAAARYRQVGCCPLLLCVLASVHSPPSCSATVDACHVTCHRTSTLCGFLPAARYWADARGLSSPSPSPSLPQSSC